MLARTAMTCSRRMLWMSSCSEFVKMGDREDVTICLISILEFSNLSFVSIEPIDPIEQVLGPAYDFDKF